MPLLIFIFFLYFSSYAKADIEIVSNGKQYNSLREYKILSEIKATSIKTADPIDEQIQQEDALTTQAVNILEKISNNPRRSVPAWRQSWRNPKPQLSLRLHPNALADALERAATSTTSAKLVVGENRQVKVMSLTTLDQVTDK